MPSFLDPVMWDYTEIEERMDRREEVRQRFRLNDLPEDIDWRDKKVLKTEIKMLTHDKFRPHTTCLKEVRNKHVTASGNIVSFSFTETRQVEDKKLELMEKEIRTWASVDAYGIVAILNYISCVYLKQELKYYD